MPIRAEAAGGPLERPRAARIEVQPLAEKRWTPERAADPEEDAMVMICMPQSSWTAACQLAQRCNISAGEILGFALKHLQEALDKGV